MYWYQKDEEEKAFRVYMAESARLTCENTAKMCPDGKYMAVKFSEIYDHKPIETRSEKEIKDDIFSKLKSMGKEDE